MKKKTIVILLLMALLAAAVVSFAGCMDTPVQIDTNTMPPESEYVPEPLDIMIFSTSYTNVSGWKKYPKDTSGENQEQDDDSADIEDAE